jgi:hypothetical protein
MPIASWMLPVLWREPDWRAALGRLASELPAGTPRAAVELAAAFEYVEPDRRPPIHCYELAGAGHAVRARELAVELGWWPAAARLAAIARDSAIAEAELWWEAGAPQLASLALAGVRADERGPRGEALLALLAGRDLSREESARGEAATGEEAAHAHVMAARFARAFGREDDVRGHLEAALAAHPGHAVASAQLLARAITDPDHDHAQRFLKLRLTGLDTTAWIDAARTCALALIATEHHRGFGLRLLRFALERTYQLQHKDIPGHLAMWGVLAQRAAADGTRLELLPLAVTALDLLDDPVDRVWIAALAAEIALRDGNHPVVAGAYAEIVAEYAPEHPILRELVSTVAVSRVRTAVPEAAVAAAVAVEQSDELLVEVDLDGVYAEAAASAALEVEDDVATIESSAIANVVAAANTAAEPEPEPPPTSKPPPAPPVAPVVLPKVEHTKPLARITPVARPASLVKDGGAPKTGGLPKLPPLPRVPSAKPAEPVLAALRVPNRPSLPPKRADPPNAKVRAKRVAVSIDVRLYPERGGRIDAHSRDISESGVFVLTDAELAIGSSLAVELLLPGKEAFTEHEFRARARVVRRGDGGYGLELIEPVAELVLAIGAL